MTKMYPYASGFAFPLIGGHTDTRLRKLGMYICAPLPPYIAIIPKKTLQESSCNSFPNLMRVDESVLIHCNTNMRGSMCSYSTVTFKMRKANSGIII